MLQIDRHSIIQIFGALMEEPQLLSDTDKYQLSPLDFSMQFDKYIFSAIYNLYTDGAERINANDIESYLSSNINAKILFEKENGITFLQDCQSNVEVGNFEVYYKKLKKVNLLKDLESNNYDISDFFCEDITNPDYIKITERFDKISTKDIINKIKGDLANLEQKYVIQDLIKEGTPAENIKQKIIEWKQKPEVGCMLQGRIFNSITRGGRKGKLYLRSGGSGTGKTRSMVGDACLIAYPIRFDTRCNKWVETGSCEKVLYVMTEQEPEEIDTMIMSYLTGYNEEVFTYGLFEENDPRILTAIDIMEKFKDNFQYVQIPNPSSTIIKNLFRRRNLQDNIENFFYDYIFSCDGILGEYRDLNIREDVALRLFTQTLKNLAVELNSFILTSTQVSNDNDKTDTVKDFRNIQGSKAVANLCDFCCMMSIPSPEELKLLDSFSQSFHCTPNLVIDIFKNRRGRWNNIRLWCLNDLGSCRRIDLFITNKKLEPIKEFQIIDFTMEKNNEFQKMIEKYNEDNEETENSIDLESLIEEISDETDSKESIKEIFEDFDKRKAKITEMDFEDLL